LACKISSIDCQPAFNNVELSGADGYRLGLTMTVNAQNTMIPIARAAERRAGARACAADGKDGQS
jgi:hypothetical protein